MEKKQIILLGIIVVFGFGSYLLLMIGASRHDNSVCGRYRAQLQIEYYKNCVNEKKLASNCDDESLEQSWEGIRNMGEDECRIRLEQGQ